MTNPRLLSNSLRRSFRAIGFLAALMLAQSSVGQILARGAKPIELPVIPDKRVALVVGVQDYPRTALNNPGLDAEAMAQYLSQLKPRFDVIKVINPDRKAFLEALHDFETRAQGAAVGFFYFAGHGIALNAENYLIPKDVDMSREDQVKHNAISTSAVLDSLKGIPAKIVVLDACRNNPFQRGNSGGLAPVARYAPEGTLIAYATSPYSTALDGEPGKNGVYTASLLRAMKRPGASIEAIFKETRVLVVKSTGGKQIPWESTSLTGTLILQSEGVGSMVLDTPPPTPSRVAISSTAIVGSARRGPLSPLDTFRDECPGCPEMVVLPTGRFRMGSSSDEPGRHPHEGPIVDVQVDRQFAIGRREVTVAEYRACVLDTRRPGDEPDLLCSHWPSTNFADAVDVPVVNVSWEDAQTYVRWLSRRTGKAYRLLSEAEWEYAARAGSSTARPWGADLGSDMAVCKDCAAGHRPDGARSATSQGGRSTHHWRLQDMLGNVWEWVADCRTDSHAGRPTDTTARTDGNCAERAIRGGSWLTSSKGIRSANRAFLPVRQREQHVGFRVAVTMSAANQPEP